MYGNIGTFKKSYVSYYIFSMQKYLTSFKLLDVFTQVTRCLHFCASFLRFSRELDQLVKAWEALSISSEANTNDRNVGDGAGALTQHMILLRYSQYGLM